MAGIAQAQRRPPQGVGPEDRVCAANKRDGSPCSAPAAPGARYCYNHDPNRADERKRNASRAGKSRGPGQKVKALDELLVRLYEDVLSGAVDKGVGAVAVQVVNARARLIETERRIAEVEAYEERLAQLEAAVAEQRRGGGRRW
jgi:hypothetical protein